MERIGEALEEIRPDLIVEGGDVKLVGLEGAVVYVSLSGPFTACCQTKRMVLWNIERSLTERFPWIEGVKAVCPPPESQAR